MFELYITIETRPRQNIKKILYFKCQKLCVGGLWNKKQINVPHLILFHQNKKIVYFPFFSYFYPLGAPTYKTIVKYKCF